MIALAVFIIALLLAIGTMEPTGGWLVTLAVLSGIQVFRPRRSGRGWPLRRRLRAWVGPRWAEEYD